MGRHKMVKGICRLCGVDTELSFEHVPPKAAYNKNTRYISIEFEDYIKSRNILKEIPKGKTKQGGVGYNSICRSCNSFLGSNYVNPYLDWVNAGVRLLQDSEYAVTRFEIYDVQPLAILKQILSMILAINSEVLLDAFPELSEFVRNKELNRLPDKYRVYTYLTRGERFRYAGYAAKSNLSNGNMVQCSELAFPPFGYLLTIDSRIEEKYLADITEFKNFKWEETNSFKLTLAQLPTYSYLPLDYRGKDQLNEDIEKANGLMDRAREFEHKKG